MGQSSYTIKKIKFQNGKIQIDCNNERGGGSDDLKGIFSEPALPSFYDAMTELEQDVVEILDAPMMAGRFKPFAVTFGYSPEGYMRVIITSTLLIPTSGAETTIDTPKMKEPDDDQRTGGKYLSEETMQRLWNLEEEAQKYLRGERAQGELFDERQNQEPKPVKDDLDSPLLDDVLQLPVADEA